MSRCLSSQCTIKICRSEITSFPSLPFQALGLRPAYNGTRHGHIPQACSRETHAWQEAVGFTFWTMHSTSHLGEQDVSCVVSHERPRCVSNGLYGSSKAALSECMRQTLPGRLDIRKQRDWKREYMVSSVLNLYKIPHTHSLSRTHICSFSSSFLLCFID